MSIDYEAAAVSEMGAFPVFKAGLYQVKVIEVEHKPDNEWKGEKKPCFTLKLQPQKMVLGDGLLLNTDGKHHDNVFIHEESGEERARYFFYNVNLPFSLHEQSRFGQLVRAIFEDSKPTYTEMFHFIGSTVIANVEVEKREDGSLRNKISTVSNDPENVIKTTKELGEIPTNELDAAMAKAGAPVVDGKADLSA